MDLISSMANYFQHDDKSSVSIKAEYFLTYLLKTLGTSCTMESQLPHFFCHLL
jgi:hypothetical protein